MDAKAYEGNLNTLLAELLSEELKLKAMSEYIRQRGRPDVVIYVNGLRVVLEGSYSKSDAENDVKKRIGEGFWHMGLALQYVEHYPQDLSALELKEKLGASRFLVRVIVPEDVSETLERYFEEKGRTKPKWVTGWMEARFKDLPAILDEASRLLIGEVDVEEMVERIEEGIAGFVSLLAGEDRERNVAKALYDVLFKLYGFSVGDHREMAKQIYAQAALAVLLASTFYQTVRDKHGLEGLNALCKRYGYRLGLRKAFEEILRVDYEPIFSLALQVVDALPDRVALELKGLVELAEECSSKRTLLRRDFSGKIYHRVVGDWRVRKGFATYFTSVPAAYLLAYLAVHTRTGVFKEHRVFVIGDFACGSGTLLTAAYNAARDHFIDESLKSGRSVDREFFHREMLEKCVWGFDALSYAVQIASLNLALQEPHVKLERMNMFAIPLGKEDGKVWLGSLEFLKGKSIPPLVSYFAGGPVLLGATKQASIVGGGVPEKLPDFDLVIMNPPFTRSTGRGGKERGGLFGFIPDEKIRAEVFEKYGEERERVRENLIAIARASNVQGGVEKLEKEFLSVGQAGEGLLFLYLAYKHVRENGKIAFVLPKSLLSGVSWFLARSLLYSKFHLEHVVVSYDPEGSNFSESTSLSETLVVARRRDKPSENEETTVTVLLKKPETSLEARALALRIAGGETGLVKVNSATAYVFRVTRRKLGESLFNWGLLVAFPDPELIRMADDILSGRVFGAELPVARLGEIASIGIDRRQFKDAFQVVYRSVPGAYPVVYGGEEERRMKMLVKPNAYAVPRESKTKRGEERRPGERLFRDFSSRLLVPERIRVDTSHVTAVYCTEPVLSNIFYSVRLKSGGEERLKALCLWLNTTWGILSVLANRSETEEAWDMLKLTHWRLHPVLDVLSLEDEKVERLAGVFDKYCDKDPGRLPQQFNPEKPNEVRLGIDKGFLEALNIRYEEEELRKLYRRVYQSFTAWIGGSK